MSNYETNPVGALQERFQSRGIAPQYSVIQAEGSSYDPTFAFQVILGDLTATGTGSSKKKAKHEAAQAMLDKLDGRAGAQPPVTNAAIKPEAPGNNIGALEELYVRKDHHRSSSSSHRSSSEQKRSHSQHHPAQVQHTQPPPEHPQQPPVPPPTTETPAPPQLEKTVSPEKPPQPSPVKEKGGTVVAASGTEEAKRHKEKEHKEKRNKHKKEKKSKSHKDDKERKDKKDKHHEHSKEGKDEHRSSKHKHKKSKSKDKDKDKEREKSRVSASVVNETGGSDTPQLKIKLKTTPSDAAHEACWEHDSEGSRTLWVGGINANVDEEILFELSKSEETSGPMRTTNSCSESDNIEGIHWEEKSDEDEKSSVKMVKVGSEKELEIKEEADNGGIESNKRTNIAMESQANKRSKLETYCLLCQEDGHVLNDDCVDNAICLRCGVKGHVRRDCYCLLCQEYGHVLNDDCTSCFNCGAKGHVRRDCPHILDDNLQIHHEIAVREDAMVPTNGHTDSTDAISSSTNTVIEHPNDDDKNLHWSKSK